MLNSNKAIETGREPTTPKPAALSDHDRHRVLTEWNQTQRQFPEKLCVHELFEEQVECSPEAVAVVFGGERWTYRQLNIRANELAHHLRARKIGPNSLVGVHAGRSVEFVVAILAVLKAGGAYVPLDPEYPAERLHFIITDARLDALICSGAATIEFTDGGSRLVHLQQHAREISAGAEENPGRINHPEHLAYVMFTSGSTGRPKGVCMPHRPLLNLIHWQKGHSNAGIGHRTLLYAPLGFDVCFQEIFSTLASGGTLVIPSARERKDFVGLVGLLEQTGVSRIFLPFVALEFLAEVVADTGRLPASLREVITAGEQLRITPAIRSLFERLKDARLVNQYGPTEAHVVSAFELEGHPAGWPYLPPIGRPIANTQLYVLDARLDPVPAGEIGELYIGGVQVAQGYLNRPELTAEKFIADPFNRTPDARLYRTGDLARHLPDGNVEFLGRTDDQVKIRGFRVELGEIETLLATHPEIQRAVVVAREDAPGEKFLAAYFIARNQTPHLVSLLREFLHKRLPDYMVPAVFILLPRFPLTPNGKIDRKALPAPKPDDFHSGVPYVAPQTPEEKKLAAIWSGLLGGAKVGLSDNFFLMGGDSLSAVKLMLAVEKATGQWLELSAFMLNPTLAGLCQLIQARREGADFETVVAIRKTGTRPPLFCLYNITGDVDVYLALAEMLGDDQPVIGIRSPAMKDASLLPASIEAAAAEAVKSIRKIQPHGAVALAGYSWAGLLAFEVARQLQQTDGVHCFTALIGPDAPMRPTNPAYRLAHFARYFPSWCGRLLADRANRAQRLRRWREMARSTRQNMAEVHLAIPGWADTPLARHLIGLAKNYRPDSKYQEGVDVFREHEEFHPHGHPLRAWQTGHLPDGGWNRWTREPNRIHWVPGNHWNVIKQPAVTVLAKSLRAAMDRHLDANRNSTSRGLLPLVLPVSVGCFLHRMSDLAAVSSGL